MALLHQEVHDTAMLAQTENQAESCCRGKGATALYLILDKSLKGSRAAQVSPARGTETSRCSVDFIVCSKMYGYIDLRDVLIELLVHRQAATCCTPA